MAIVVDDIVKQQARDDSNNNQRKLNRADDEVEGAEHDSQVRVHISNRKGTGMVGEHVVHVASFDLVGLEHIVVQSVTMDHVFEEAPENVAEDAEVRVLQNVHEGEVVKEDAESHCHIGAEVEVRF